MNSSTPLSLHYLPLIDYFRQVMQQEQVVITASEEYQKQTYRNRTTILTANKVLSLSVPVFQKILPVNQIRIDYSQSWLRDHLRGITAAYKHAPYFEFYFPYFEEIYLSKPVFLFELNKALFHLCLRILKFKGTVIFSYHPEQDSDTVFLNTSGSSQEKFVPYQQVFGTEFTPNLSIIDLLFNLGPDSAVYLR